MKYDFDNITDRRNTDSYKWEKAENGKLPMWVADMDFRTAPEVIAAMQRRLDHGVFGYNVVPEDWSLAYINWWKNRHGFEMKKEWLIFCTGVVPAISSVVRKLTTPGEKVAVLTPCYNIFFNSIVNNGCTANEVPLLFKDGEYLIDWKGLEGALSDLQTTLMILCNPHNPVGRIWTKEELEKIGVLAEKHHVRVISDEIHCDITEPGKDYVPFASVSESCRKVGVICISPSKAFNFAGLQTAAVCVPDDNLNWKVTRALNTDEVAEPNSFAVTAAVSAYNEGAGWLDALRKYLWENRRIAENYIKEKVPALRPVSAEATYLMWIDVSGSGKTGSEFAGELEEKTGLIVTAGEEYGKGGENYIRLNLACPKTVLLDGLLRLAKYSETLS